MAATLGAANKITQNTEPRLSEAQLLVPKAALHFYINCVTSTQTEDVTDLPSAWSKDLLREAQFSP